MRSAVFCLLLFFYTLAAAEIFPEAPRCRFRMPWPDVSERKFWSRAPGRSDFQELLKQAEEEKEYFPPALPENRLPNRLTYRSTLSELRRRFRMFTIASLLTGKTVFCRAAALHLQSLYPADWSPLQEPRAEFPAAAELELAAELAEGTALLAPRLSGVITKKVAAEIQKKVYAPWKAWAMDPAKNPHFPVRQGIALTRILLAMPPPQPQEREFLWKNLWLNGCRNAFRIGREPLCNAASRAQYLREILLWMLLLKNAGDSPPQDAPWEVLRSAAFLPERLQLSIGKYPDLEAFVFEPQLREEIDDLRCRLFGGPMRRRSRFHAKDETLGAQLDALCLAPLPRKAGPLPEYEEFRAAGLALFRPEPKLAYRGLCGAFYGGNARYKEAGSFVLAVGRNAPLLTPSPGPKAVLPVPLAGGESQQYGAHSAVPMLLLRRTEQGGITAIFDLAPAYRQQKELKKLRRSFRILSESFTVTDSVEFSVPQSFESVLFTPGAVQRPEPDMLLLSAGEKAAKNILKIRIQTGGDPFDVTLSPVTRKGEAQPCGTRIGILLAQPVASGEIRLVIQTAQPEKR